MCSYFGQHYNDCWSAGGGGGGDGRGDSSGGAPRPQAGGDQSLAAGSMSRYIWVNVQVNSPKRWHSRGLVLAKPNMYSAFYLAFSCRTLSKPFTKYVPDLIVQRN